MKLRIKGNSIRFRLQQSEVKQLMETGRIAESCAIGPLEILTFELALAQNFSAGFLGNILTVTLPTDAAQEWADSDENGIETSLDNGTGNNLKVFIEKDYACLTVRSNEDDTDAFPNPNKSC
jgi:hypothetical protein